MAVVAVYAPHVAAERPAFFAQEGPLQQAVLACPGTPGPAVFLAGDFNCVMRPEDVWGGAPAIGNRGQGAGELASLLATAGLQDVWGCLHGHRAALAMDAFTYLSRDVRSRAIAARLDYVMAPAHLVRAGWAGSCRHRRDIQPSDVAQTTHPEQTLEYSWQSLKSTQ